MDVVVWDVDWRWKYVSLIVVVYERSSGVESVYEWGLFVFWK